MVTGTFHNLHTALLSLFRTLPDCADLPPGLYASTMGPSHMSHKRRIIPLLDALLASYWNQYTTMCQFRTITTTSNSHISPEYAHIYNTSCFFKKTHGTHQLYLSPQEATTSKGGNLLRRHTRLLGNPEPPSTTCFVHNIQSPSQYPYPKYLIPIVRSLHIYIMCEFKYMCDYLLKRQSVIWALYMDGQPGNIR